jgi:hypothetical protein
VVVWKFQIYRSLRVKREEDFSASGPRSSGIELRGWLQRQGSNLCGLGALLSKNRVSQCPSTLLFNQVANPSVIGGIAESPFLVSIVSTRPRPPSHRHLGLQGRDAGDTVATPIVTTVAPCAPGSPCTRSVMVMGHGRSHLTAGSSGSKPVPKGTSPAATGDREAASAGGGGDEIVLRRIPARRPLGRNGPVRCHSKPGG